MAINHAIVSVGSTATLLTVAASGGGKDGSTILVQNPSGQAVYLGGAGVTTSSYGYILAVNSNISIELNQDEALYGVVTSSTQSVAVLRQGV